MLFDNYQRRDLFDKIEINNGFDDEDCVKQIFTASDFKLTLSLTFDFFVWHLKLKIKQTDWQIWIKPKDILSENA